MRQAISGTNEDMRTDAKALPRVDIMENADGGLYV